MVDLKRGCLKCGEALGVDQAVHLGVERWEHETCPSEAKPSPRPIAILACGHWVDRLHYHQLGGPAACAPTDPDHGCSYDSPETFVIYTFAIIDQVRIDQARTMRDAEERLHPQRPGLRPDQWVLGEEMLPGDRPAFCDAHVERIVGPHRTLTPIHPEPLTDDQKVDDLFGGAKP